jgi:hypothetical protein
MDRLTPRTIIWFKPAGPGALGKLKAMMYALLPSPDRDLAL